MANTNINIRMDAGLKRVKKEWFCISLLTDIIKKLAAGKRCQRGIEITSFSGIIRGVVSATLPQIDC